MFRCTGGFPLCCVAVKFHFLQLFSLISIVLILHSPARGLDLSSTRLGGEGDGRGLALAWQASNHPAVSYVNGVDDTLYHSEFDGDSWNVAAVVPEASASAGTALVYQTNGPSIFYVDSHARLMRAVWQDSQWSIELIDSIAAVGGKLAAAECGADLCVAYFNQLTGGIQFAEQGIGGWLRTSISSTAAVDSLDFVVSPSGVPTIVFTDAAKTQLYLAERIAGAWSVSSISLPSGIYPSNPRLAFNAQGQVAVVYSKRVLGYDQADTAVYYTQRQAIGLWEHATVSDDYAGGELAFRFSATGVATVVFRVQRRHPVDPDYRAMALARLSPEGLWQVYDIEPEFGGEGAHYLFFSPNLLLRNGGEPLIAYYYSNSAFAGVAAGSGIRIHALSSEVFLGGDGSSSSSSTSSSSTSSSSSTTSTSSTTSSSSSSSSSSTTSSSTTSSSTTSSTTTSSSLVSSSSSSSSSGGSSTSSSAGTDSSSDTVEEFEGLTGVFSGVTFGSSAHTASCAEPSSAAPEEVIRWVPSQSGTVVLDTCGSQTKFDTVLYIREGALNGPTLACNDDTSGCAVDSGSPNSNRHGSRISLSVVAGREYFIFVDSYVPSSGASSGAFKLKFSHQGGTSSSSSSTSSSGSSTSSTTSSSTSSSSTTSSSTSSSSTTTSSSSSSSTSSSSGSSSSSTTSSSSGSTTTSSSSSTSSSASSSSSSSSSSGGNDSLDSDTDGLTDEQEQAIGTDPHNPDTDADGVSDGKEVADDTNPLDAASALLLLPSRVCAEWNGYLSGIWNVLEHINMTQRPLDIRAQLYDYFGVLRGIASFGIAPGAQFDALVHGFAGHVQNSYGKVCSEHNGEAGDLDGRMVYYKPVFSGPEAGTFQFAFAMPFTAGYPGEQIVLFNTYQPSFHAGDSANLVANWVQITNTGEQAGAGRLLFFGIDGDLLGEYYLELAAGERRDFAAHTWGRDRVGFARWVPDSPESYFQLRNVRYLYDNPRLVDSFATAFQLEALKPSGEELVMPYHTNAGQMSVVELANTANVPILVSLSLSGATPWSAVIRLEARETRHIIVNGILGADAQGMVRARSNIGNSLVAVVMQYAFFANGKVSHMYGIAGRPPLGQVLRGSFNRYLGQSNELVLVNASSDSTQVRLELIAENGERLTSEDVLLDLPAADSLRVSLDSLIPVNRYGAVRVFASRAHVVSGHLLRQRGAEYVVPTPLRE